MRVLAPDIVSPGTTQTSSMPAGLIVLILSISLGIQPVTTDLYLPALPAIKASFNAPTAQAQLTLSALLLAFGISQLVWGPLSDRFGRRPILLLGLVAYTAAAFASALATSMEQLITWRVVQGVAMGAVVMCARAIVRDLYQPQDGARIMSKGLSGLGLLACVCAPLGGLLAQLFSWRASLLAVSVFGCLSLGLMALRFKETLTHKNPRALQPAQLLATWRSILTNRTFAAFSILSAAAYGALFIFLASSSFVFIDVLGLSRAGYGLMMFLTSLAYISGTFLCRRLLARYTLPQSVAIGALFNLLGGTMLGVLAWAQVQSVWAVMLPMAVYMVGHGIQQPCGQAGAAGPFPQAAGTASAMNGFLMMLVAFVIGLWLGPHMNDALKALAYGIWLCSVVLAMTAFTLVRKYGEPAQV
jgi:DHA1 family bicyclomycin/chloramphenicol resistance-like MFS transporter